MAATTHRTTVSYLDALRASVHAAALRAWTHYLTDFTPTRREAWGVAYDRLAALRSELGGEVVPS
jgi:hypothetical protein